MLPCFIGTMSFDIFVNMIPSSCGRESRGQLPGGFKTCRRKVEVSGGRGKKTVRRYGSS